MAGLDTAPWPAVPPRLASLAAAERQAKEHSHGMEGRKDLIMEEVRDFISRQHVRVARNELPWVCNRGVDSTLKGLWASFSKLRIQQGSAATLSGLTALWDHFPG